jgi:murein L,D-transpeptidase YafK
MFTLIRKFAGAITVLGLMALLAGCGGFINGGGKENAPLSNTALTRLKAIGSTPGDAMVVRIFKQSSELEVWKHTASGQFKLFNTYKICAWSGDLGPKVKEGDRQSPEGFYTITPGLMNPKSNYYLSFNTGFPNKFDRAYGRSGSDLMVHGDCSSRGCYAMTDEGIAEIYALARESFRGGNPSFQLQIFPFRMTPQNLAKQSTSPHLAFWKNIKEGYDRFEVSKQPPVWDVCDKHYVFDKTPSGQPLDAAGACPVLVKNDVMIAQLAAKQAADEASFTTEVASLQQKEAKAIEDAKRAEAEAAAAKARGEAINASVNGFFGGISGAFGGGEKVTKVVNPNLAAPVPAPRIKRG